MSTSRRSERPSGRAGSGSKPSSAAQSRMGCVVESYGRRVVVLSSDTAERLPCKIRGRRTEVVAGDLVRLEPESTAADGHWVVAERLPRRNVLQRTDSRGGVEDIASNLDQLGIVVAPRPTCDPFIIDRYLAGAGYAGIDALLILNKQDLIGAGEFGPEEFAFIDTYRRIGIPVVTVSAKRGTGLDALKQRLQGRRTLLAGQSGVGKSSLTNALCEGAYRATSDLSVGSGQGKHTTVSSVIVQLPWGELTDSPGVRDYAPPVAPLPDVQRGYLEIIQRAPGCRFQNCLHLREPQCAVQAAVESGEIDPRRLESYRRLVNLTRQLDEKRGW
ncbi:MAG: ribosome small subunit-dependent GTPase A [Steroidobacteraceae bacterium]|nr:ribosome small subunit-dependent GTPase A [Steroidobacteraceae bacterium]MBP9130801.1 ribosome small subunit-dependent GTPase A [Steroidobacteraceae bacterium]